jgi:hypothetical protein
VILYCVLVIRVGMFGFTRHLEGLNAEQACLKGVLRCDGGSVVRDSLLQGCCDLWRCLCRGQNILARHVGCCMIGAEVLLVEYQSGFVGGG